jgi:ATP-dependent helicase/nuclease subunit A
VDAADELLEDGGYSDKKLLEAKLAAQQIKFLMAHQKVTDHKTGELRKLHYSDIVILLRSLSGQADGFASVLNDSGIPAHTLSATGYFSAVEVQTVLAMLRILDNPRQDIPLAAVLKSPMAGLTDEELARLRLTNRTESFHACVLMQCETLCEEKQQGKTKDWGSLEYKLLEFYEMYQKLRKLVPDTPIHELIGMLLKETGYGDYAAAMPAGNRRRANLEMLVEKAIAYEKTSYKGLFHFVRYIDELQKYDVDFGEADLVSENQDVVRIMSIHKSKGLEFPVVFVCGLGKNFNKQDTKSHMVLHPELGIGLDLMDGRRRVKSATIAKKAIAKQIELENLGEELRVLYVALTRAKEKLILMGCMKDAAKKVETLSANPIAGSTGALSYLQRERAAAYLDWVLGALTTYGDKYKIHIANVAELVEHELTERVKEEVGEAACLRAIADADEKLVQQFDERFRMEYSYVGRKEKKNKYSVSELKHRAMREKMEQEEEDMQPVFAEPPIVPYIPDFVRKKEALEETEEVNRGALRGTAVHRVMECYSFEKELAPVLQVEEMLANGQISAEMKELVNISKVEAFVSSQTGGRMKAAQKAGKLYREKPFVMGFTGEELAAFGFEDGDKEDTDLTLIQGIIDVFWMEEDGVVLLDYKTDRVETKKELIDRYRAQLELYSEALERVLNKSRERKIKVKERLIYSFGLGTVILL